MGCVTMQTSTSGRRHLMAVGNGQPGVEVSICMTILTTAALAPQQSTAIQNAVEVGTLSSKWSKLGDPQYPLCTPPPLASGAPCQIRTAQLHL